MNLPSFISTIILITGFAVLFAQTTAPAVDTTQKAVSTVQDTNTLAMAEDLFGRLQFDKAKDVLNAILLKTPNEARAYDLLRQIHSAQNNRKEEIAALEKFIELAPSKKAVQEAIGIFKDAGDRAKVVKYSEMFISMKLELADRGFLRVCLDDLANGYESENKIDDFYRILVQLIQVAPKNENYHFKKGLIDFNRNAYTAAFDEFKEVNEINPSLKDISYYYGECAFQTKKNEIAIRFLEKAALDNTDKPELYLHLAQAYEGVGNSAKAAQTYESYLDKNPKNREIIEKLIALYEKEKNDFRLMKLYDMYQEVTGSQDPALLNKQAKILSQTNPNKAIAIYEQILVADPRNTGALTALVELYDAKNERAKVLSYLDRLMQISPTLEGNRKLANLYLESKDSGKAIEALERYTSLKSDAWQELLLLGRLYLQLKQDDKASVVLSKIVNDKSSAKKDIDLGELYNSYGIALSRAGKKEAAIKAYEMAVKENPDFAEAWFYLGAYYLETEKWQNAIDALLKCKTVGLYPEKVNKGLAKAYYLSKNYAQAVPYLEKMLADDPENKDYMVKLATSALAAKQPEKAGEYFKKIGDNTVEKEFAGNLQAAMAFIRIGNDASGRTILKQVIEKEPKNETALRLLIDLELRNRNFKDAIAALENLYVVRPEPSLKKEIGDIALQAGDLGRAVEAYEIYLASNNKDRKVLDTLLAINEKAGNTDKAYPLLNNLISIAPKNEVYHFRKGLIDFNRKEYSKAVVEFNAVAKINPLYDKLSYYLGESEYYLKNYSAAEPYLARAVFIDKDNIELARHLADTYEKTKKSAEAGPLYEKLLKADPKDKQTLESLIAIYESNNNKARLEDLYLSRMELSGKDKKTILSLAEIYRSKSSMDKALKAYEDAYNLDNTDVILLSTLADMYEEKKDLNKAALKLEDLVNRKPDAMNNQRLAGIYLALKDTARAIPPLERYTLIRKEAVNELIDLALCYVAEKEFAKAEIVLKKILDLKPVKRQGEIYLAYALVLENNGKIAESVSAYENAVKFDSRNGNAFYKIAVFYLRNKDWKKAISPLLMARELKVSSDDVNAGLADAYYNSGEFKSALPYVEAVNANNPGKEETLERLANIYLNINDAANAVKYLNELNKKDPSHFESNFLAASAFVIQKDDRSAEPILLRYIDKNPKDSKALRMLADIYKRQGNGKKAASVMEQLYVISPKPELKKEIGDFLEKVDADAAAEAYEIYIKSAPKDKEVLEELRKIYEAKNNENALYPVLQSLVTVDPKNAAYLAKKGEMDFAAKRYSEAISAFLGVKATNPKDERADYILGESFYNSNQPVKAEQYLIEAVGRRPQDSELHLHLAKTFESNKKEKLAAAEYEKVLVVKSNDEAVIDKLILIYERTRDNGRLIDLYGRKQGLSGKKDKDILLKLAAAFLSEHKIDEAILSYEGVLNIDGGNVKALTALADLYEGKKNLKKCAEKLEALMLIKPDAESNLRLADIYLVQKDTAKAIAPLERYTLMRKDSQKELFALSLCYINQKEFGKAETVLKKILALKPVSNQGAVTLAYAQTLEGNGKMAEAVAAYEQAVKFDARNGDAYYKMAIFYLRNKEWKKALSPLLMAKELKVSPDDVNSGLADVYYNLGELKSALPYVEAENVKHPGNEETLERLVNVYLAINDPVNGVKYLNELNRKNPARFESSYLAAYAYILQKDDRSAEPILTRFADKNPKDLKALRALADLYKRQGNNNKAADILEKMYAIGPRPELKKEKGDLLEKSDAASAAAAYEVYIKSAPKDRDVLEELRKIYEAKNNEGALYPVLQALISIEPKNAAYLAKKGEIDFAAKRYAEAASAYLVVKTLNPRDERVDYVLGESYYFTNQLLKAEPYLADAIARRPQDTELHLHLAQALEAGKKEKAASIEYEKVLAVRSNDEKVIDKLIEIYENLKDNGRLIDLYGRKPGVSGKKDKELMLKLAAAFLSERKISEAILAYEGVLAMDNVNVKALAVLSDLYEGKKDLKKSAEKLESLVQIKPDAAINLRLAKTYLSINDSAKAIPALERYTILKKGSVKEMFMLALCYLSQKDFDKAETVLKKITALKPQEDQADITLAYARVLEGNGKMAEAISAYEQVVKFNPKNGDAFLKMAVFYLRNREWKKALSPLLKARELKVAPDDVTAGLADVYYNLGDLKAALPFVEAENARKPGNEENLERLVNAYLAVNDATNGVKYLNELNRKNPAKFEASYLAAFAYILQKDDKSAEPILVRFVDKNPKDQKALRALADLYKRQGNGKKASSVLDKMYAIQPRPELKKEIGDLLEKVDADAAASAYEIYLKSSPKDRDVLEELRKIYEAKSNDKALYPVLQSLITIEQKNTVYLAKKGEMDFAAKRYSEAVNAFTSVKTINPKDERADYILGESYYNLNQLNKAEAYLTEAIIKRPQDVDLHLHLAQALEANKKIKPAALEYEKVLASRSNDEKVIDKLISIYESLKDNSRLIDLYGRKQGVSGKKDKILYMKLAQAFLAERKTNEAILAFEGVLEIDGTNQQALTILADLYESKKDLKKSADKLEALVMLKPDPALNLRLAKLYLSQKDSTKAIPPLERYNALKKESVDELYTLGLCYLSQNDKAKAETALQKVVLFSAKPGANRMLRLSSLKALQNIYSEKKDTENLKKVLSELTTTDPSDAENFYNLGSLYYSVKAYDAALPAFLKANALKSGIGQAPEMISSIYYNKKAYKEAVPFLEQASRKDPKNVDMHRMLAIALSANPLKTREAAIEYETVLNYDPKDVVSAKALMVIYQKEKRQKELLSLYEKIVSLEPGNKEVWGNLARLSIELKDDSRTEKALLKTVELEPKNASACISLADLYVRLKKPADAIKFYGKAVDLKTGKKEDLESKIGFLYLDLKNKDSAQVHLYNVVEANPYAHEAAFALGKICEDKKDPVQAISYYDLACEVQPNNGEYQFFGGRASFRQSEYPNAKAKLIKAFEINPKLDEAAFMIGQILMIQNNAKQAAVYFNKAYSLKRENLDYLKMFAEANYKAGAFNEATPLYSLYLKAKPEDFEAHCNLGIAYMKAGSTNLALTEFDKVYASKVQLLEDDYEIGKLYYNSHTYTEAKRIILNVLRTHPENAEGQEIIASISESEKDLKGAVEHYEESVKSDKNRVKLQKKIGDLYIALGREDKAVVAYEAYLIGNRDLETAKKLLAIYKKQNRKDDVRRMLNLVTSLDPRDTDNLMALGQMDYEAVNTKQALTSYLGVIKVKPSHPDALYMSGKIYLELKEYNLALPNLMAAYRLDPSSSKPAMALATLFAETKKPDDAIIYFNKVLTVEPKNVEVLAKLIELYRAKGRKADLLSALLKKTALDPRSGDAYLELGKLYIESNKGLDAEAAFKKAIELKGECLDCYLMLAEMNKKQKQVPQAIEWYKKAAYVDTKNPDIYFTLGKTYMEKKDSNSAMESFEKVLAIKKDHSEALEYLSGLYIAFNFQKKAINMLQEIVKQKPKYAAGYKALGKAYLDTKEYTKADQALKIALSLEPNNAEVMCALGDLYKELNERDKSIGFYTKAYQLNPRNPDIGNKYADALYDKKDYKAAIPVLLKLYNEDKKDAKIIAVLMDCYLSIGDSKEAMSYVGILEKADPEKISKNFKVGKAFYRVGQPDKALSILEKIGPIKDKEYFEILGNIYKEKKQYGKAAEALRELFNQDKSNLKVGLELGDIYEKRSEEPLAAEIYQSLEISFPRDPEIKKRLLIIYRKQSKYEDIRVTLMQLINLEPNNTEYLYDMAKLLYNENQKGEASSKLLQVLKLNPKHARASALYGKILLENKDYESAERYLGFAAISPELKDDPSVNKDLGMLYKSRNNMGKALTALEKAYKLSHDDMEITIALAETYKAMKEKDQLMGLYQAIVKVDSKNAVAHKGLGDLYFEQKKWNEAMAEYTKVIDAGNPDVEVLNREAGLIQEFGNNVNRVIELYQASLRAQPSQPDIAFKLGTIFLQNRGNEESAKEQFEQVVLINPQHYEAYRMLGKIYLQEKDDFSAIRCYKKALKIKPTDGETLKELAQILLRQNDLEKAEPVIVEAIKYNPQSFDLKIALARKYIEMHKYKQAEPLLSSVYQARPNDVTIMMDLINIYNNLNESSKAIPLLDRLIKSGGATNEIQMQLGIAYFGQGDNRKAKETLEKILTKVEGTADAVLTLGLIYYEEKDYRKAKIAMKKALELDPSSVKASFALGEIAFSEGDFDLAVAYYERVLNTKPDYEGLYNRLAECYLSKQEFEKAKQFVLKALKDNPTNGSLYLGLGKSLYMEGDYASAQKALVKAEKLLPDNDEPVYYNLLCLIKSQQADKAMTEAKQALMKFKRSEKVYVALAQAYIMASQFDKALKALELAIRLTPNYKDAFKLSGDIYYQYKQDGPAALSNYKRFMALGGSLEEVPQELHSKLQ